jgi:hypothetical protein
VGKIVREFTDEMTMGDTLGVGGDDIPPQIWCESCQEYYGVSHIVDSPGHPKHGQHF